MKRKLSEEQRKELDIVFKKCLFILDFSIENVEINGFLMDIKNIIIKCYENDDIKCLRDILNTVILFAKQLPDPILNNLNSNFKKEFGELINDKNLKILSKILKKGFINSEKEYRIIFDRVEELYSNNEKQNEVNQLNELLFEYDKKQK